MRALWSDMGWGGKGLPYLQPSNLQLRWQGILLGNKQHPSLSTWTKQLSSTKKAPFSHRDSLSLPRSTSGHSGGPCSSLCPAEVLPTRLTGHPPAQKPKGFIWGFPRPCLS